MRNASNSLRVPLLAGAGDALPQRWKSRSVGAGRDADAVSHSEEVQPGTASIATRELWDQYRAKAVQVQAQEKEWAELGDSSDSHESFVPCRQERYALAAREMHDAATPEGDARPGARASGSSGSTVLLNPGKVKSVLCFLFFIHMNLVLAALLVLLTVPQNRLPVLCLGVIYVVIIIAQVQLSLSDRRFLSIRQEHWVRGRYGQYLVSLLMAIGVLGVFQVISLVRAVRFRRSSVHKETLVSELDCQELAVDGTALGNNNPSNMRVDSGAFFVAGFPLPFVGAWLLMSGHVVPVGSVLLAAAMLMSALIIVVACIGFDYQASHFIQWLWSGEPYLRGRMRACHLLVRLLEVIARMIFGVAVTEVFPDDGHRWFWFVVWGMDCALVCCLMIIDSKPARSCFVMAMVALMHFVADFSRFVDENGFARAAKKLSRRLARLRAAEVVLVAGGVLARAYSERLSDSSQASVAGRVVMVTAMVLTEALCQLLSSRHTALGRRRQQDLFTAAEADNCELLRYFLEQENIMDKNARSKDYECETPLHVAVLHGHVRAMELLIQEDANVSVVDAQGDNPLHTACRNGLWRAIELLLEGTQDGIISVSRRSASSIVHRKNKQGLMPIDLLPASVPARIHQLLHIPATPAHGKVDSIRGSDETLVEKVDNLALTNLFGPELGRGHGHWRIDDDSTATQVESLSAYLFAQCVGERVGLIIDWRSEAARNARAFHVSALTRVKTLGAGSFGKVIQVKDEATAEEYALKIQLRSHTQKQAIREAQALDNVAKHPFIVQVVHIFHTRLYFGILMELCDQDLNRRIVDDAEGGLLEGLRDKELAARYTLCMSLALHHLHSNRIIFRDLKPENVLVTGPKQGDHAKLTDFGLACRVERYERPTDEASWLSECGSGSATPLNPQLVRFDSFAGTRGFMPQEVFEAPKVSRMALRELTSRDWYALGCTLLLMLFGERLGTKVCVSDSRTVLLPPHQDEMAAATTEARKWNSVPPEAITLVEQLTEVEVRNRGDFQEVRTSPFLQAARSKLEAESRHSEGVAVALEPLGKTER